ncbi:MAG TPA: ABC transporter ATP-binding protein, partial [Streptosporangiaceae bacterium]
ELIARIGAEFGLSVVVASHLLGEIEQICDHLVAVEAGRLLRAGSLTSLTQSSQLLLIEVADRTADLAGELGRRGLEPRPSGRGLLVPITDESTCDVIRDAVADLGLALARMEQRRHRVEELFRPAELAATPAMPATAETGVTHAS